MEKDKEINNGYLLGSLSQALRLIDYLADNEYSTLTQIAQAMELSKTVVFRQLYTLQHHGFVDRSGSSAYTLGHRFVFLGQKVLSQNTLHQKAKGVLGELTGKYNETSHMGILDDESRVLIVSKVNADVTMQMTSNIGKTLQAYCSAMGKCLLAYADDTLRQQYFAGRILCKYAANTLTEMDDFEREFVFIRQNGYSFDNEESEEGLFCVAVPVIDKKGHMYAAISLSGPVGRMQGKVEQMIESLRIASVSISALTESAPAKH